MFKKKLNLKISLETLKIMGTLTVIFTLIGFVFGRVIEFVFLETGEDYTDLVEAYGDGDFAGLDEVADERIEGDVNLDNVIYFMQLGVFETLDNALALGGTLDKMGFTWAVNRLDGRHYVFSHIVGNREQLESVEEEVKRNNITPYIKALEVTTGDLGWYYFLMAVNQVPYEMESSFIQSFTNDEMHIFGFYVTLSSVSFEPLSNERQEMLLEIYHWLAN